MNIMELGALGEFVGAIAVVATLAYLAIQVRASARNTATDARQRVLDSFPMPRLTLSMLAYTH